MKLPKIVHRVIYALPVISCLLFVILFIRIKYTLNKLDIAIDHYNKSEILADQVLSALSQKSKLDSTVVIANEIPPLSNNPADSLKDTHVRESNLNIGKANNVLSTKASPADSSFWKKADSVDRSVDPNFTDFDGSSDKEVIINRSDKFTKLNLILRYRFMTDSNFKSTPPLKGVLYISESTNFGWKEAHELTCKLSSVRMISPDQIEFVFKEPEGYKSTSDTNPINNKFQRRFIFTASVNKSNISGILKWTDLADDMMSKAIMTIPMTLFIK